MWSDIRQEIERARRELGLTPVQFRSLRLTEWPVVEKRMYLGFTEQAGKLTEWTWLWAKLVSSKPRASLAFDYQQLATYLPSLIDRDESCFVFFEGTVREQTKFWWYECTVETLMVVMDELWGCEIGVMNKRYQWLLMLTHHDDLVGIGMPIAERLRQLKTRVEATKR